jgi:SAM-dependent methyltransferase
VAVYDLLAAHYDVLTGDSAAEAAFLRGIIEQRHSRAATLLDIACGTGGITARLAGAYHVTGLDISPGMLAIAREKLPAETPLHLADMTGFDLGATFDVAVCAYQGVNHLLDFPAWESFFDRVHRHLNDGGVFVFDIVTVNHLAMAAAIGRRVRRFGDNYVQVRVRAIDEAAFEWNIEVFERQPDGRYKRLRTVFTMRSFPLEVIREALRQRFTGIATIDRQGHVVGEESEARTWFVCTMQLRLVRRVPPTRPTHRL